jgi:hypothetical protein
MYAAAATFKCLVKIQYLAAIHAEARLNNNSKFSSHNFYLG